MLKTVRRERLPQWAAIAVMIPISALLLALCDALVWLLLSILADALESLVPLVLIHIVFLGLAAVFARKPARFIYELLRWSYLEISELQCGRCMYDLSGNMSGVCPECGEPIPDWRDVRGPAPRR